ncbi:tripartite tricarboxylate transporter substrate binding protein [Achromobacter aegrifaciens]|nr:tripartite tricarboxylate transporter substrate binding protein [Achromobacter aegrifaciens]
MIRPTMGWMACAALFGVCAMAQAQEYPNKAIHLVVPYPPGGGTDVVARAVAQRLQAELGQPVVVENKPGASEIIGTGSVARAAPDGYTIGLVTSTYSINWVLDGGLPYRPAQFAAVAPLGGGPMLALAPAGSPHAALGALIAARKRSPGRMNYASLGPNSLQAMSSEWLKHLSGADLTAVAYKGAAPALVALSTGEVDFAFAGLGASRALLGAGKLRPLAVSTRKALPAMPDLGPVAADVPGFDIQIWYGLVAPAGVPRAVLQKLNTALSNLAGDARMRQQFADLGNVPMAMGLDEFDVFLAQDAQLWRDIITAAAIKPQ